MAEKEKVAVNILVDHFGDIVAQVVTILLAKGPRGLRDLTSETKLKMNEVRKGLLVALQHGLVLSSERKGPGGSTMIVYTASMQRVLQRQHIPDFVQFARRTYSSQPSVAQQVLEDVVLNGRLCVSAVLENATTRTNSAALDPDVVRSSTMEVFSAFARNHLVCRAEGPDSERFLLPHVATDAGGKSGRKRPHSPDHLAPAAKRTAMISSEDASCALPTAEESNSNVASEFPDSDCVWEINFHRLYRHLRNEAITTMVSRSFDAAAGAVMDTLLRLAELKEEVGNMTAAVTSFEVFQSLASTPQLSRAELNLYLKLLSDGTNAYVLKVGDNAGGTYCVQLDKCLESLVENAIVSIVQERFGSKCLRIFRLLLDKKHLEEKQIGDMAMIPAKEAKELLYRMLKGHFVTFQEIPRTPDHAPSRTFYLFSVNRHHVAKTCLQLCFKSLLHLQQKRLSLEKDHRRLLQRQQQFEQQKAKFVASSAENVEEEIAMLEEDLLPPADKATIKKLQSAFARLDEGEQVVGASLLCFSKYEGS